MSRCGVIALVAAMGLSCSSPNVPTTPPVSPPPTPTGTKPCGTAFGPASLQHVVWIWMENRDYSEVIGSGAAPYENQLAAQCGAATNYTAIGTPSLPNYIAAISGATQGIADNNPPASHPLNVASLYTQLAMAGLQWRDYEESAPGNCPSADIGQYAVRHDPAPYFTNIAAACATWDVPMGTTSGGNFLSDLSAGMLPAFSFVTPNLCNDTHDCPVTTGDQWLASWMPIILAAPNYRAGNTAVFLVWDEGNATNHVPEITISPITPSGATSATRFDHYSLLKTAEQLLGLPMLGNASSANSMIPAFFSGGQPSVPMKR